MTDDHRDDHHGDHHGDHQDDHQDEQVRRLLADARHTEPMPDDVAARLDGVLADLRADRPVRPGVADLAAARRRRRARTFLVAAAALVVAGLGIDQIRQAGPSDSPSSADSAVVGEAEESNAGGSGRPRRENADVDGGAAFDAQSQSADPPAAADAPLDDLRDGAELYYAPQWASRVDSEGFGRATLRIRDRVVQLATEGATSSQRSLAKSRCRDQGWGAGRAVLIRYDGSPAVLVYRPVRGDTQVVDLFLCGRRDATRSITLPAP